MSRIRWAAGTVALVLLGALALAGPVAAATTVIQVLGRNAVTYTSYPFDPTPTSKWTASAQGESVDTNGNGIADSLRGRAAVLEDYGIIRARIYRVVTQALIGGVWATVQLNENDVVSEAPRAYAVSYTAPTRYCATDPALTRSYRVVNPHAVRRVDNIVAYRTTVSHTFTARALASDPACPESPPPPPAPTADVTIAKVASVDEITGAGGTFTYQLRVTNHDATDVATGVVATDTLPAELEIVSLTGCTNDADPAAEPDTVTCNFGSIDPGETEVATVTVSAAAAALTDGSITNTATVASSNDADTSNNTSPVETVLVRPLADVAIDKAADQSTVFVPGDNFRYVLRVSNTGPSSATNVTAVDTLPDGLEVVALPAGCTNDALPLEEPDTITCVLADPLAAGASFSWSIDVVTDATRADDTAPYVNTARVSTSTYEQDTTDNADSVTVTVVPSPTAS